MSVVLHPTSEQRARTNLKRTVLSGVAFSVVRPFLGENERFVAPAVTNGMLRIYGINPGADELKARRFAECESGDLVAFSWDSAIRVVARVVHAFRNPDLAEPLNWGPAYTREGVEQIFELVYALSDVTELKNPIDYDTVRSITTSAGFTAPNFQGWNTIRDGRAPLLERLLDAPPRPATVSPQPVAAPTAIDLNADTDITRITKARREQAAIRRYVVIGAEQECALCHRVFPSRYVWAAHIKRRSECTTRERNRVMEVAMPACTFGCDQLWEDGYLSVDDAGSIIVSTAVPSSGAVAEYVEQFRAKPRVCRRWNPTRTLRVALFAWHRENVFLG